MATRRRRSSNADDIRARLGIEEAPEPEPTPEPEPEAPASEDAGAQAPAAGAASPAASEYAHEDYASAVAEPEDAPIESPVDDWRAEDDTPIQPIEDNKTKLYIIAAVVAAVVGLGIGLAVGKVLEANLAVKRQVSQAQRLEEPVNEAAKRLAALEADLDTMSLDPKSKDFADQLVAFNERLAQDLSGENKIPLSAASLKNSVMVLAHGDAGPALNEAVTVLGALEALFKNHESSTVRDQDEIKREIEGTQDDSEYAIIFDVKESQKRFSEHADNPDESNFAPVSGIRVTLPEDLEVKEQNDDYFYELRLPNGQKSMIPIYAVISLPRNQLVSSSSTETGITRFMGRAERIKEAVADVARAAKSAQEAVEHVANR